MAGTGTPGFTGDAGPATSARLAQPNGVAEDGSGNLFIADSLNHAIQKVAAGTGVITARAGTGTHGFTGDGVPVVSSTSLPITLTASVPAGTYQVRVIGLSAAGQIVGTFSDAVTVIVQ